MSRGRPSGLLVLALFLSGCVAVPVMRPQPAAPPPPTEVKQQVRLHLPVALSSLDPAETTDPAALDVIGNLMEGLVAEVDGSLVGGAAESWETADGREYLFHLRPEARWSDGEPIVAQHFVDAWLHMLDPAVGAENAYLLYDIAGAEEWNALDPQAADFAERSAERKQAVQIAALDERRLQVILREPNPGWVAYTAHPAFSPRRPGLTPEQVSSGPFMLADWSSTGDLRLQVNPHYWDRGAVALQTIHYHVERDGQSALRLYEMGHLDQVILPGDLAAGVPGLQSMAQPSTMGLVFNTSQPRLANADLRRAISLAIDRSRLAYEVAGASAVASASLVPPSLAPARPAGASPAAVQGDLLQARKLWEGVRESLNTDRITLRLLHARETTALARSLQAMLQAALEGLTIELHTVPFDQRQERMRFGQFDLVLQGWVAEQADPLSLLELFTAAHPANSARWVNEEYDARVARAKAAAGEERAEAAALAEQVLLDEVPVLPLYHPVRHWAVSAELQGVRYRPLGARFDLKEAFVAAPPVGTPASERESRPQGRIG